MTLPVGKGVAQDCIILRGKIVAKRNPAKIRHKSLGRKSHEQRGDDGDKYE